MKTNYGGYLRFSATAILWLALCPAHLRAQKTSSIHAISIKPTVGADMAHAGKASVITYMDFTSATIATYLQTTALG